jgi:hypothetical protein
MMSKEEAEQHELEQIVKQQRQKKRRDDRKIETKPNKYYRQ